ncbi:MAG: hypothetical protein EBT03_07410 [Betaproteobacteria bacterium]|nr:hypothetical protein [Betaproteobacteria bacterium]NCA16999.1 hypothetical protein [Betaproteobacteria bacterium]
MLQFLALMAGIYFLKDILFAIFVRFPLAFIFCLIFISFVTQGEWSPLAIFSCAFITAIMCVVL